MTSVIESFCYRLKDAADVTNAKDKAKESGKTFSEYLLDLSKQDIKKK